MLTATLGGLIKDYRLKKRLSQLEVSLRIGWKDSTRLSKIEQGRVSRPTRETLDQIIKALGLNEHEKGEMLLASSIIPSKSEVKSVLLSLKERLKEFRYPLLLVDFAWNFFYFNDPAKNLYQISEKDYAYVSKYHPNWLEMLFLHKSFENIEIKGGYSERNTKPFKIFQISHFKFEQAGNTNENWFGSLLAKLSQDHEFRQLWLKVPPAQEDLLYEYEFDEFNGIWSGQKKKLKFHVFSIHPTSDFRFYLMIHQPADQETFQFCENHLY